MQNMNISRENRFGSVITMSHHPLNFLVDSNGSHFTVILMLGYFSSQENLLFLRPKREWSHTLTHTPFTDRLPSQLSCPLNVVTRPCRWIFEDKFFCYSTSHINGQIVQEIFTRISMFLLRWELLGHA